MYYKTSCSTCSVMHEWCSLPLAADSEPLLRNSVILVHDTMTKAECLALSEAAEARVGHQQSLSRVEVKDMDADAQELCTHVLLERVLYVHPSIVTRQ